MFFNDELENWMVYLSRYLTFIQNCSCLELSLRAHAQSKFCVLSRKLHGARYLLEYCGASWRTLGVRDLSVTKKENKLMTKHKKSSEYKIFLHIVVVCREGIVDLGLLQFNLKIVGCEKRIITVKTNGNVNLILSDYYGWSFWTGCENCLEYCIWVIEMYSREYSALAVKTQVFFLKLADNDF